MTDKEFIIAIEKFGIDILLSKAKELVKRPGSKRIKAYENNLRRIREYNKRKMSK